MKKTLRTAFIDTLPVLTGYLVLGFGFGIIVKVNGFSIWHALVMSGFVSSLIGCLVVGLLYIWKRNTLLSVIVGTVSYMLLVQFIF